MHVPYRLSCFLLPLSLLALPLGAFCDGQKAEYVHAVTRGKALLPWQSPGVSEGERAFREEIEARKDALLAQRTPVLRPAMRTPEMLARARENIAAMPWAERWLENQIAQARYALEQGPAWLETMIPELSPANAYGFTCPNCVGKQSQEGVGSSLIAWNYRDPEFISCRACGQRYPDPAFPEDGVLQMPRQGQTIRFHRNPAEQANPEDRTGALAWRWVGYPIQVSFTGIVREYKVSFMMGVAQSAALAHAFTGEPEFARAARDILLRYAHCYRNWLYRDYWGTYADCDPMYAAYHDRALPLEWKRHPYESAYAKDTAERAAMLQNYWGAGRIHASTDSISSLGSFALTYDLTCEAVDEAGVPVWSDAQRNTVERDLLLEYLMGAEPYVGGPGKAESANNKAPRIYRAMADVAKCLGLPNYADVALQGYERIRDESFLYDGFSTESPSYTQMYLSQLVEIPEALHGFTWPEDFPGRAGRVDYYASDTKLRNMYRTLIWTLVPDGSYLPLSDTHVEGAPSEHLLQLGVHRFPGLFDGVGLGQRSRRASDFALFNLTQDQIEQEENGDLHMPETLWPAWQTAILRADNVPGGSVVALPFNPAGGHRHQDNLALFYWQGGTALLGDLGYVGDMPLNRWIRSTHSHNLVIVDDQEQRFSGRKPELGFMATSPLASVVEAYTDAYEACPEYRRRVALLKVAETSFVVDLFRVQGGSKHAFRVYSEHAASDTPGNRIEFSGISMPEEAPLPEVGASLKEEDIFGLRDVRTGHPDAPGWQASWRDDTGGYRLWMLSPCDRVEVSNGPGQRTRDEAGRRVRYLDAVRTGEALESQFIAIHEPLLVQEAPPALRTVERIETPEDAVVLKLALEGATLYLFNDLSEPFTVDGISFQGTFAAVERTHAGAVRYLGVAASLLEVSGVQHITGLAQATGAVTAVVDSALLLDTPLDAGWHTVQATAEVQPYVRVLTEAGWTGLPLARAEGNRIEVRDYPAPEVRALELPSVRYGADAGN